MSDQPTNQPTNQPTSDTNPDRNLIGIIRNDDHILAWNYEYNLDILVTASKVCEGEWNIRVESDGTRRLEGTVFGGKWLCDRLVRFLRNGMTSRRMRGKGHDAESEEASVSDA